MPAKSRSLFIKWALLLALPAAISIQLAGCDPDTTAPTTPTLSARYFKDSVQPIFEVNSCTNCHHVDGEGWAATGGADGGLDLTNAYASLVNKASNEHLTNSAVPRLRVKPGFPDSSYLFHKVNMDNPESGGRMPLYGSALPDSEIAIIKKWILNDAPLGDTTTH